MTNWRWTQAQEDRQREQREERRLGVPRDYKIKQAKPLNPFERARRGVRSVAEADRLLDDLYALLLASREREAKAREEANLYRYTWNSSGNVWLTPVSKSLSVSNIP